MATGNSLSQYTRAKILLCVVFFMGVFAAFIEYSVMDVAPDTFQLPGNALQNHIGLFAAHLIILTALMIGTWKRQHWSKVALLSYFFVTFIMAGVAIPAMWYQTSEFPFAFFAACVTRVAAWLLVLHSTNIKRLANPAYVSIYTG